jgi:Ca2+-binding RTX toxin-like protein
MRSRLVRSLPLLGVVPLVLFLLPSAASPSGGPRAIPESLRTPLLRHAPFTDLDQAVRGGVVARELASATGPLEGFLILDADATLAAAVAAAPSAKGRAVSVLGVTRAAYGAQKDRVLGRLRGVTVLQDYDALPMAFVRFSGAAAALAASNDPEVSGVAADQRREATLAQSLPLIRQPTAAASGFTGVGTSVAVLDSGVDFTRSAFGSCTSPGVPAGCRVVFAMDTAPNDGVLDDAILHGTNVAGIVAGVAPGASLLAYDVFTGDSALDSDIVQAINSAISNQATFNVRAMNLSLGEPKDFRTSLCDGLSNPYVTAFANARAVRITPVVAAGNDASAIGKFTDGIGAPACTPGAVSVGAVYDSDTGFADFGDCFDATTTADQIPCFSQSASILTVLAPGSLITAAGITQEGTSQASPHVAGAVAVLAAAAPAQTVDAITSAIANSGPSILDSRNGVTKHRFDLPDAVAAIQGAPSPSPTPTPTPGACTIVGTNSGEVLQGTSGDDVICGNGGGDYLISGGGNDVAIGGGGFDFVSFEDVDGPVVVDLGAGTATGAATATLQSIEGVVGSAFDDTLSGDAASNDILGLGGDDAMFGSGGFDYLRFDFASGVTVDLSAGLATGEGDDSFSGFEAIVGSRGGDSLTGRRGANEIFGLRGADDIAGLGGPDDLFGQGGADLLLGGGGNDDLFGGPGNDTCIQGPGTGLRRSC